MLFKAGRVCAIGACLALASCGRIGVVPIADESREPDDVADSATPPVDEPDASATDADAGELDAGELDASVSQGADAAAEASTTRDAADDSMIDATALVDATTDAQEAAVLGDAASDATAPTCSGATALNLCWYLGAPQQSCDETCASHGGYDPRMTALVGTRSQGGSADNCRQVMTALGRSGPVLEGTRPDDIGVGCHVWGPDLWWLADAPDFTPSASGNPAEIACACMR